MRHYRKENAVSPVVSVVLLVAVVVLLSGLVFVTVFDTTSNINTQPQDTALSSSVEGGNYTAEIITSPDDTRLEVLVDGVVRKSVSGVSSGDTIRVPVYEGERVSVVSNKNGSKSVIYSTVVEGSGVGTISQNQPSAPSSCTVSRYNGSGTQSDPYEISSSHDLQCMSADLGGHYELTQNINADGTENWNSGTGFSNIGSATGSNVFSGSLDGNGYAVDGLTMDKGINEKASMFRTIDGSNAGVENIIFKNVDVSGSTWGTGTIATDFTNGTIKNVELTGEVYSTKNRVGGLVGRMAMGSDNTVLVENVNSDANVRGASGVAGGLVGQLRDGATLREVTIKRSTIQGLDNSDEYENDVGGVVGEIRTSSQGIILENIEISDTTIKGTDSIGGVVGLSRGGNPLTIQNVVVKSSTIESDQSFSDDTGDSYVGGIIGDMRSGNLLESRVVETSVGGGDGVGGAIGRITNSDGLIEDVDVTSSTTVVSDSEEVGGVIGQHDGGIAQRISSKATVSGERDVGGLTGRIQSDASITVSYSDSIVNSNGSVGGITGQNSGVINKSYSISTVQTNSTVASFYSKGAGGIAGVNKGSIDKVYAAGSISGDKVGGVVGAQEKYDYNPTGTNDSYWDKESMNVNKALGEKKAGSTNDVNGLNTAQMQGSSASSNMPLFDFTSTWETTSTYPSLSFE